DRIARLKDQIDEFDTVPTFENSTYRIKSTRINTVEEFFYPDPAFFVDSKEEFLFNMDVSVPREALAFVLGKHVSYRTREKISRAFCIVFPSILNDKGR
ncbi:hypothetical protein PENTCL1PPCAC_20841, partial [Pristionchus entomophagus]